MNTTVRISFAKRARRDHLVWICDSHIAESELTSFGLAVAPFDWRTFESVGGHIGITST